ncbi:unnamed protein product [Boreogadus saida]
MRPCLTCVNMKSHISLLRRDLHQHTNPTDRQVPPAPPSTPLRAPPRPSATSDEGPRLDPVISGAFWRNPPGPLGSRLEQLFLCSFP